ncbi:hypothetical protein N0V93_006007 [Gnomoniopsis smithogilvyi]|uniref:Dipeptidyl-peptidase V n=1 Tax=Gnomoniopsis smithogilvyi TaxID=1191159 RepID=A0A9W9CUB8_9PEZI|nr:hypothetical protein N0V93_006007 [Gnomoniopsis smithogilvyi]
MRIQSQTRSSLVTLAYMATKSGIPTQKHAGSGLLYIDMPVRMLCAYADEETPTTGVFLTRLEEKTPGNWVLEADPPRDLLQGSELSFPSWLAFDNSYELSPHGLYVSAVGPCFDVSRTFSGELYFVPFDTNGSPVAKTRLGLSGWTGMPHSVSVSKDCVLFLQSQRWDTTFDHDTIFLVDNDNGDRPAEAVPVRLYLDDARDVEWKPLVLSVQWSSETSKSSRTVHIVVEERGKKEAWQVRLTPSAPEDLFVGFLGFATHQLLQDGCISSMAAFSNNEGAHVLTTRSTFDTPCITELVSMPTHNSSGKPQVRLLDKVLFNESTATHQNITVPSSCATYTIQAFLHKPTGTAPQGEKHPVVLLIHGGPSDAWRNNWTRNWNPHLWTAAGFAVVTPNLSGSTGFGLPFALSVHQNWGGRPLADIVSVLDHLTANADTYGVDVDRVVAAGPSFGGFLINFLAGHPALARRFRALIVHGGIFHTQNLLAADVPVVFAADFGGLPWEREAVEVWRHWDPAALVGEWTTPVLFTHGNIDYRVPVTEALAAFHAARLRGVPTELLIFPDEAHQIVKSGNIIQWQTKLLEWSLRWTASVSYSP